LKTAVCHALATQTEAERGLLDGLPMLDGGGVVLLITPIDQAAPVGRLILPQVRLIRECLDRGLRCHVTTPAQLPDALKDVPRIALAVTDSQVFGPVGRILPDDVPLTSFSILTARQKGDFDALQQGAQAVRALKPGDRVLIAEACTHTTTHEDIGRVKIPQALEKQAGGKLAFDYAAGGDFPDDLDGYRLVVHCGGCMLTGRMFAARQGLAREAGVPFTNYGLVLALAGGATPKII
jgi:[FeFe] hydrogenase H-cluster maturation GTPase HydF